MLTKKYLFIALLCVCNAEMYIYIIKMPFTFTGFVCIVASFSKPLAFFFILYFFRQFQDKAWWEADKSMRSYNSRRSLSALFSRAMILFAPLNNCSLLLPSLDL